MSINTHTNITLNMEGVYSSSIDRSMSTLLMGWESPTACSSREKRERLDLGATTSSPILSWEELALWRRLGQPWSRPSKSKAENYVRKIMVEYRLANMQ